MTLIWFNESLQVFRLQATVRANYLINKGRGVKSPLPRHCSHNETPSPQLLWLQCKHHLPPAPVQQHWGSNLQVFCFFLNTAPSSVGSPRPPSLPQGPVEPAAHVVVFATWSEATVLPPPQELKPRLHKHHAADADAQKPHKIGFTVTCAVDAEQPATWSCTKLFIEVRGSGAKPLKRMTRGRRLV